MKQFSHKPLEADHGDCSYHYRRCAWLVEHLEGDDVHLDLPRRYWAAFAEALMSTQASIVYGAGYGERSDEVEDKIAAVLAEHPDGPIFQSLARSGTVRGATLLA